jgi:RND family efflux transporter MFP subunit
MWHLGFRGIAGLAGIAAFVLSLSACDAPNTYVEPPPPKVTVAKPLVGEVTDYLEFTGTLVASGNVEVRARVSGELQSMSFEPGTHVAQGDVLFIIDPREYEANLQAAEAEVASAEAQFKRADTELKRAERLFEQKAGSEANVVKWRGDQQVAGAAIQRAEAKVERAKLELSYTQVAAPISGRVGRNLVDIGNLVGAGEATVLTEITQHDPMYVYVDLNEHDLLRVTRIFRQRVKEQGIDPRVESSRKAGLVLELGLSDEQGYPHQGVMDFGESGLDPDTGTVRLRGVFANSEVPVKLFPGLFARVRMPYDQRADMPLVTERAVGEDQSGPYVLVVNAENTVEKRGVRLGRLEDGLRVIEEGVQTEDRVVVNGLQRARPGAKVDPEETEMASLSTSARKMASAAADSAESASAEPSAENAQQ